MKTLRTGRPRKDLNAESHHIRLEVDHESYVAVCHAAVDAGTSPSEIIRRATTAYLEALAANPAPKPPKKTATQKAQEEEEARTADAMATAFLESK